MLLKWIVRGLMTHLPGPSRCEPESEEGAVFARYCYSVWLRHLVMAARHGLPTCPEIVAELGPGDSLGVAIAAILSGVREYYAFDVVEYARNENNLRVLDECIRLFASRAEIPGDEEFPKLCPRLDSYAFPSDVLTGERLARSLNPNRIRTLRQLLTSGASADTEQLSLAYCVPWTAGGCLRANSVDMVVSQAVLEHVDDLDATYRCLNRWLKPRGVMSHVIDFKSHGITRAWNGHWVISDLTWKMIRGRRPYLLNRQPHSAHLELLAANGFEIVADMRGTSHSPIRRKNLARRFRSMTDDDFVTSEAFVQAVKTAPHVVGGPM